MKKLLLTIPLLLISLTGHAVKIVCKMGDGTHTNNPNIRFAEYGFATRTFWSDSDIISMGCYCYVDPKHKKQCTYEVENTNTSYIKKSPTQRHHWGTKKHRHLQWTVRPKGWHLHVRFSLHDPNAHLPRH